MESTARVSSWTIQSFCTFDRIVTIDPALSQSHLLQIFSISSAFRLGTRLFLFLFHSRSSCCRNLCNSAFQCTCFERRAVDSCMGYFGLFELQIQVLLKVLPVYFLLFD
jgi:hypothetical protein